MIEIKFINQPSNIGKIQQFEDVAHLEQWQLDSVDILNTFDNQINAKQLTMNPEFGTIQEIKK